MVVMKRIFGRVGLGLLSIVIVGAIVLSFPTILAYSIRYEQKQSFSALSAQFPVTVNPQAKSIVENARVNAFLESTASPLQAAVGNAGNIFGDLFASIAIAISNISWYQSLAAVTAANVHFVAITPGMRKEQVASAFAKVLDWNTKQTKAFLTATSSDSLLPLSEGSFSPGTYVVSLGTTPTTVQSLIHERFYTDVISHYGTTTMSIVPLSQALTVASLIQRETEGSGDMRLVSGIIWNRLFANMNLQIDATLQYAKATIRPTASWWPKVVPADEFIKSPYNTYLHAGLPPTPIANPSVAAILAALNPINTSCLFYFNDTKGNILCSDTYAEHVVLLKKYYGQGK